MKNWIINRCQQHNKISSFSPFVAIRFLLDNHAMFLVVQRAVGWGVENSIYVEPQKNTGSQFSRFSALVGSIT